MTMSIIEKAIETGRSLSLYEDSEQTDQGKEELVLDYLWQSLYDIYKLAHFGILEEVERAEIDAVVVWLGKYQPYTENYKEIEIPF